MSQTKFCSIRVGERLYNRIAQHIQYLKCINKTQNKQKWIEDAILKKLEREDGLELSEYVYREKFIGFNINAEIDDRVEKKVALIKKFCISFSKKKWILESIFEKLDLEEKETEKKAKKLFKNILEQSSNSEIPVESEC